jgi:hypothetical protein
MSAWFRGAVLALIAGGALSACAAVDNQLSPRSYAINAGWDRYRNDSTLLNIVRASHSEPLNFVAVSKYTGLADLTAGASAQFVFAPHSSSPTATYGPIAGGAKNSNTFDAANLDTQEFYTGIMTSVDIKELHWLLRQGIPRELIFHLLLDSIKLTLPNGDMYELRNDPTDDQWTEAGEPPESFSPRCEYLAQQRYPERPRDTSYYQPPFGSEPMDVWRGLHYNDCRYHKFRYFIRLAINYGLTTEQVEVANPKWPFDKKTQLMTLPKWQFCYDAAIASEFGLSHVKYSPSACGSKLPRSKEDYFEFGGVESRNSVIRKIAPVLRSPMAVFRYLGVLLRSQPAADRVTLATSAVQNMETPDPRLLTIVGSSFGCFAEASHFGEHYCVPAEGAENTKSAFSVLGSLVALHIKRTDLPASSTVLITP